MKKLLAIFICLSMVLTCMSGIVFTASAADSAILTAQGITGSGTEADPYIISTGDQFKAVFGSANTTEADLINGGHVWAITNNIDISGYVPNDNFEETYTYNSVDYSIGVRFQGTLKGMDATTKEPKKVEIYIGKDVANVATHDYKSAGTAVGTSAAGLFYGVKGTKNALTTFSDLSLKGSINIDKLGLADKDVNWVGALFGNAYNQQINVTNVDNYVAITAATVEHAGGLAGVYQIGTMRNCHNYANISGMATGGLIGMGQGASSIIASSNQGNITGKANTGGIEGYGYANITDSYNTGDVTGSGSAAVGGITGKVYNSKGTTVERCWNSGNITTTYTSGVVAGIVGQFPGTKAGTMVNCFNTGIVSGGKKTAAAVADVGAPATGLVHSINGFYDLANTNMPAVHTVVSGALAVENVNFVYVVGDATDDDYTDYVTAAELQALTTTVVENSPFNDSSVWVKAAGFNYPQLASNPYTGYNPDASYLQKEGFAGSGTAEDPYIVDNDDKLRFIFATTQADEVKDEVLGANVHYLQTVNIDLGTDYSIKTGQAFYGSYRGGNIVDGEVVYSVKNVNVNKTNCTAAYVGLVAQLYGTVTHISVSGAFTNTNDQTGAIAGRAYPGSLIANCSNSAAITARNYAGGIVGNSGGTVIDCSNSGAITATARRAGGIAGDITSENATIKNCVNTGSVTAVTEFIGGITGRASDASQVIENCVNKGSVSTAAAKYTGGIIGYCMLATVKDCTNEGEISGGNQYSAGVVGYLYGGEVKDCVNLGKVNVLSSNTAGVVAYIKDSAATVKGCVNKGTITNVGNYSAAKITGVGGVVGYVAVAGSTIEDCHNEGALSFIGCSKDSTVAAGVAESIGGVVGYVGQGVTITKCTNKGTITATLPDTLPDGASSTHLSRYVGGIVGRFYVGASANQVTISECWNSGNLAGVNYGGGIVGNLYRGGEISVVIENVLNTGAFPESTSCGAIVGYLWHVSAATSKVQISNAYTTTTIKALCKNNPDGDSTNSTSKTADVSNVYVYSNGSFDGKDGSETIDSLALYNAVKDGLLPSTAWKFDETLNMPVLINNPYTGHNPGIELPAGFGEFAGGTGESNDPFIIKTLEQFNKINTLELYDKSFKLDDNIETVTVPVGTYEVPFTGTFDGAGFTIDIDFYLDDEAVTSIALFPNTKDATIKDLTITGEIDVTSNAKPNKGVAAFVGQSTKATTIENCINKANIEVLGASDAVAGIVGRACDLGANVITGCANYGTIKGARAAGISGVINGVSTLSNCVNYGYLEGRTTAAGIMTWSYGGISNCANFGTVKSLKANSGIASGIIATLQTTDNLEIKNCFNAGTLDAGLTYGIAVRSTGAQTDKSLNGDINYKVINCYNLVTADYPIADEGSTRKTEEIGNTTLDNCFYLAVEAEEAYAGSQAVTDLESFKTINLGGEYSIKDGYPYLASVNLDKAKLASFGISKVTLQKTYSEENYTIKWGKVDFGNYDAYNVCFVQTGAVIPVNAAPSNKFYKVTVFVNTEDAGSCIEEAEFAIEITKDTEIVAHLEKVVLVDGEFPIPETVSDILTHATEGAVTIGENTYDHFALIAGKVPEALGANPRAYGIVVGHSPYISYTYDANEEYVAGTEGYKRPATFTASIDMTQGDEDIRSTKTNRFGVLLYGNNLIPGKTYYVKTWAKYNDANGVRHVVESEAVPFTMPEVAEN